MKIGLISDTHGFLDPRIASLFHGVEHILHAGDIGPASLILSLERIAPVTAVTGNTDSGIDYRETEVIVLEGRRFLVHHIVDVRTPAESVRALLEKQRPDVVVSGHSHKPHSESIGQTLFLNPGYAGKSRFNLPRSVALLHLEGPGLRTEFMPLP
jgi:putative phosphoesterase